MGFLLCLLLIWYDWQEVCITKHKWDLLTEIRCLLILTYSKIQGSRIEVQSKVAQLMDVRRLGPFADRP